MGEPISASIGFFFLLLSLIPKQYSEINIFCTRCQSRFDVTPDSDSHVEWKEVSRNACFWDMT